MEWIILNITIMPNKRFIRECGKLSADQIAVILCTSGEINTDEISDIRKKMILHFDDISSPGCHAFDLHIAQSIKAFIDTLSDESLYVCCDSGESRSSAIAAAILRYQNEDSLYIWDNPHYHPNIYVYKIMCRCFGKRTPGFILRYLQRRNAAALRNAIRKSKY